MSYFFNPINMFSMNLTYFFNLKYQLSERKKKRKKATNVTPFNIMIAKLLILLR